MLFVTILVHLTLARVNLDIQEMAKIALVSYVCLTRASKFIDWKKVRNEMSPHENQATRPPFCDESFSGPIVCNFQVAFLSTIGKQNSPRKILLHCKQASYAESL